MWGLGLRTLSNSRSGTSRNPLRLGGLVKVRARSLVVPPHDRFAPLSVSSVSGLFQRAGKSVTARGSALGGRRFRRRPACRREAERARSAGPEARRLVRAAGGVAGAVGVRAGAGELAAVDDQVLLADRAPVEPALEDLARARRRSGPARRGWCPRCAASCRGGASMRQGWSWAAGWGNHTSPA